jgi:NADH dehydrogenase FAD-containing subunit
LTGIEAATELVDKLRTAKQPCGIAIGDSEPHVILADRKPWIGSDMGENARSVIEQALQSLEIETRTPSSGRHTLPEGSRVLARPVLGGLHHEYRLENVAA